METRIFRPPSSNQMLVFVIKAFSLLEILSTLFFMQYQRNTCFHCIYIFLETISRILWWRCFIWYQLYLIVSAILLCLILAKRVRRLSFIWPRFIFKRLCLVNVHCVILIHKYEVRTPIYVTSIRSEISLGTTFLYCHPWVCQSQKERSSICPL